MEDDVRVVRADEMQDLFDRLVRLLGSRFDPIADCRENMHDVEDQSVRGMLQLLCKTLNTAWIDEKDTVPESLSP